MEVTYNETQMNEYKNIVKMFSRLLKAQMLMALLFLIPIVIGIVLINMGISIFIGLLFLFFGGIIFIPLVLSNLYNLVLVLRLKEDNFKIIRTEILKLPEEVDKDEIYFYNIDVPQTICKKSLLFVNPYGEKIYGKDDKVDVITNKKGKAFFAIASMEDSNPAGSEEKDEISC